ncbi:MAG TPA: hypothetical protein VGQ83_37375 [Polyangia bacterium]|jgi:hypothetical protein
MTRSPAHALFAALVSVALGAAACGSSSPAATPDAGAEAAPAADAAVPDDALGADAGGDARGDGGAAGDGGAWSVVVVDEQPKFKSRAAIAMAADGTVHLAYNLATSADGWGTPSVWYARGQGDSFTRTEVAPANAVSNEYPVIVLDGQGAPVIVYNRYDAAADRVDLWAVRGDGAGGFVAPLDLTAAGGVDAYAPSAAAAADGTVHVVYQQRVGTGGAATYSLGYVTLAAGVAGPPATIAPVTAGFSLDPDYDVAVAPDGAVHVVYCQPGTGGLNNVLYHTVRAGGTWSAAQPLTPADQDVWGPSLAVDGTGAAHLAWVEGPDWSTKTLHYARRTGGTWLTPQPLGASIEDRDYYLGLAVEPAGTVHLAFTRFYGGNADVLYLTGAAGVFAGEVRLTTTADGDESAPAVAVAGGHLAVSYVENLAAAPAGKLYLARPR